MADPMTDKRLAEIEYQLNPTEVVFADGPRSCAMVGLRTSEQRELLAEVRRLRQENDRLFSIVRVAQEHAKHCEDGAGFAADMEAATPNARKQRPRAGGERDG